VTRSTPVGSTFSLVAERGHLVARAVRARARHHGPGARGAWASCGSCTRGRVHAIRVITCRAYGFHSASALISFIALCCSGLCSGLVPLPVFETPTADDRTERSVSGGAVVGDV
jgi:hypothetical protein